MTPRPVPALSVPLALMLGIVALAGADVETWPTVWRVNGNGETGTLELSLGEQGAVKGRLLNEPIEGFITGRRLLLRRQTNDGVEVWEGWLAAPRSAGEAHGPGDGSPFLAGTFAVSRAGGTGVFPWYATPEAAVSSVAPAPAAELDETAARPDPAAAPPAREAEPSPPRGTGGLSGTWMSLTGDRFEIRQDERKLTVVLADGSTRLGRMTGSSTLVVGLRRGCCNGELKGTNTIVWNDGARWLRAD